MSWGESGLGELRAGRRGTLSKQHLLSKVIGSDTDGRSEGWCWSSWAQKAVSMKWLNAYSQAQEEKRRDHFLLNFGACTQLGASDLG